MHREHKTYKKMSKRYHLVRLTNVCNPKVLIFSKEGVSSRSFQHCDIVQIVSVSLLQLVDYCRYLLHLRYLQTTVHVFGQMSDIFRLRPWVTREARSWKVLWLTLSWLWRLVWNLLFMKILYIFHFSFSEWLSLSLPKSPGSDFEVVLKTFKSLHPNWSNDLFWTGM